MSGNRHDEAFWKTAIELQSSGDLSVPEFCAREGLSSATFYAWRRKLRGEQGPKADRPSFVRLAPSATEQATARFPDGTELRVGAALLPALVAALRGGSHDPAEAASC